uniref:Pentapeptide repeat protein n=1 Tax=Rhodococcus sp. NS1 TaxID=402236 RepID=A0A097SPI8_9NOCA|nr:hypothetical protein LRS1606.3 [Rhodococcus sp. NS1]
MGCSGRASRADRPASVRRATIGGVDRCGSGALDAASAGWSVGGIVVDRKGEWDRVSQPDSTAGGATGEQVKVPRDPWSERHANWHNVLSVLVTGATGFLIWWIIAEATTPDGTKVWRTWRTLVHAGVILVGAAAGWYAAGKYRVWQKTRTRGEDDTSLFWLVAGGILASLVLAAAAGYAQAELLTTPGEPVTSLDSSELLDIARSTTFALGALGAVAVLLVNYRKQRAVEAALRYDQAKHRAELANEDRKQRASEIAALHDRYTKAVEQLANKENSAIRLGGVHALAALGDDWAAQGMLSQRQVCVDLLCSYLRSNEPFEDDRDPDFGRIIEWVRAPESLREDRDVRKAALEWLSRLATADYKAQKEAGFPAEWPQKVKIDLRGVVLRDLDLSYATLSYLPLRQADLVRTDLTRADLTGADLREAELRDANLMQVAAVDANLMAAKMTGASMRLANLRHASFTNADLSDVRLIGTDLRSADLTGARLDDASLVGARVDRYTSFISARLIDTDFDRVDLSVIDPKGVNLSNAKNVSLVP